MKLSSTMPQGLRAPVRRHRKFFSGLLAAFLVVIGITFFFNTWVNPLWVAHMPWTNEEFADFRQYYRNLRTGKAGLAASQQWDVALVGSSRMAIAMDPTLEQWGDQKVVNLAFSAATVPENSAMVKYLLKHQKQLKHLIVGVDLADLTRRSTAMGRAGFYESPLNEKGDRFDAALRNTCGSASLIAAIKTIDWKVKYGKTKSPDYLPPYTARGQWLRHRSNSPLRKVLARDSIPQAIRWVRWRQAHNELIPSKLAALHDLLDQALSANVKTTLLIPPSHAGYMMVYQYSNDSDACFMIDRRTIVEAVEKAQAKYPQAPKIVIWDFNDFHPLNAEPLPPATDKAAMMNYWIDGTHSHERLGKIMLSRMMGWPLSDPLQASYGTILDASNVNAREQQLREGYKRYQTDNAADWKWATDIVDAFSGPAEIDKKQPEE